MTLGSSISLKLHLLTMLEFVIYYRHMFVVQGHWITQPHRHRRRKPFLWHCDLQQSKAKTIFHLKLMASLFQSLDVKPKNDNKNSASASGFQHPVALIFPQILPLLKQVPRVVFTTLRYLCNSWIDLTSVCPWQTFSAKWNVTLVH